MNTASTAAIASQHRRSRLARLTRGGILLVLALGLPIATIAWLDAQWVLAQGWRWCAFAATAIATVFALAAAVRSIRRADARAIAAAMDASAPLPGGYIISTSREFAATASADATHQAMLARLHAEAGKLAATCTPHHPWPGKSLVATAAATIALTVALVLTHGPQPLLRTWLPWRALPYTTITLMPPDARPAKNEAFTIRGGVHGRPAPTVLIALADGQRLHAPVAADGTFIVAFPDGIAEATTATAFAAADGVSPAIPLDIRDIPALAGYQHTITPPAYTRHSPRFETQPSFALLRASTLHFHVTFDRPATGVRMIFDNFDAPLDLEPANADALTWRVKLAAIPRTFGYHLEVSDRDGTYPVEPHPQQIVATPDAPPTIRITESNAGDIQSRNDTLTLTYTASDDIGLANVAVRWFRIGDDEPRPIPLAALDGTTQALDGEWRLSLADLDVRPLDMLVVVLEAVDGNSLDGPGIGYSEPLIIEIPETPGDGGDAAPPSDSGGEGGEITQINPLEMQRQIYRDTLRTSLRHGTATTAELADRQQEIPGHLATLAASEIATAIGPAFTALLATAATAATQSATALDPPEITTFRGRQPGRVDIQASLRHQATAISAMLDAARMQMEFIEAQEPAENEGEDGEAEEQTVVTLIDPTSQPQQESEDEDEARERIAQALLDLQQALEQQEQLNQELDATEAAPSDPTDGETGEGETGEGTPSESPGSEPGTGQPGTDGHGGEPTEGDPTAPTEAPQTLAEQQLALEALSRRIEQQIENLQASPTGADPQFAAEQMRRAAEFQRQAAEAILQHNLANAAESGGQAEESIRSAIIITESLLDRNVQAGIEAAAQPTGYQGIIQDYSRRLSYDQ